MRIGVQIPDSTLGQALVALLRSAGHDVVPLLPVGAPCHLRIATGTAPNDAHAGVATLVLRRTARAPVSEDPIRDLQAAIETGGTVTWDAPLDAPALLAALGEARPALPAPAAPSLAGVPYPWLAIDPTSATVVAANREACSLLGVPPVTTPLPLADVALTGSLRAGVLEASDGLLPGQHLGGSRIATWWTDDRGLRVLTLLGAPHSTEGRADRHLRTLADVGRMAATLAHEIRNPVASLAGALDLLADESDPSEREEIIKLARGRLNQMRILLDDTLRLARPIEGPTEPIDVHDLIQSALHELRMDAQFEDMEIDFPAPEAPIIVGAHPEPLRQAMINLVLNAAQAQEGRGRIQILLEPLARHVIIRVADEGPGIPAEARQRVFSPFYTTRSEGTGLGLAFVRRVVDAAGGDLAVENVKRGACIRLELPLAFASSGPSEPGANSA